MEKSVSQVRMEEELQRLKEERLMRMGIPPQPMFKILKNRDIVDYVCKNKTNFIFKDDPEILAKYRNPTIKALMDDMIKEVAAVRAKAHADAKDALEAAFDSIDFGNIAANTSWSGTLGPSVSDAHSSLGIIPSYKWVPVELPLYVGQQKASEVMELMEQIHQRHGDDDTGSLYKVQDAFDGFVNAHDTHIRAGNDNGVYSAEFQFWLRLPSENYANLLSSWPRDNSAAGSYVTIHVTARVVSLFFVGYDLNDSPDSSPLRVKLHIKCQNGHENRVEQVLSKLLLENGTFYVIGAADLNGSAVETFEISKMGFVDVLSGREQILLN